MVRNKITVFESGFGDGRTIYQGPPSEANDAAWDDLYNSKCGVLSFASPRSSSLPYPYPYLILS